MKKRYLTCTASVSSKSAAVVGTLPKTDEASLDAKVEKEEEVLEAKEAKPPNPVEAPWLVGYAKQKKPIQFRHTVGEKRFSTTFMHLLYLFLRSKGRKTSKRSETEGG
jgi:hypothetical protein